MASNIFNITPGHNNAKLSLRGDMALSFNQEVSSSFVISLFTVTNELFSLETTNFKFKDLDGNLVNGLIIGGKPGLWIELMFDPAAKIWYITSNNLVDNSSGAAEDHLEKSLVFAPLPAMTAIDYAQGMNYRGVINGNAKLANPTNMKPGDRLKIIIEQGKGGSKTLAYDSDYGFYQAVIPNLSTVQGKLDILDCYMTGDNTLICDLKTDYSIVRPIAYGSDFFYTMGAAYDNAQNNPETGQTVRVLRDGWRTECNGTIGQNSNRDELDIRVQGIRKPDGEFPLLRLDKSDRPAYGKALINVEGGRNVVIENLGVAGASSDDGNGTGILLAGPVKYALISNIHLLENEDGVRSNPSPDQQYDLMDVLLERNGWARIPEHAGYSHSIYAGAGQIWRGTRCTFSDPVAGHNIKTRMRQTVLNQVYARRSNKAREFDCPDSGLVHAFDCVFWKDEDAVQNNLIGIGHEMISEPRPQEYFFVNCYFHNDVGILRDVTFLENFYGSGNPNSVAVHFIDCEFGGAAATKLDSKDGSIFQGPYTITLTGGPTGPRVPVGDERLLFNPAMLDPNRKTNPLGIPLTPFENLPPMTVTDPTPAYPDFVEPLSPLPPPYGEDDSTPVDLSVITISDSLKAVFANAAANAEVGAKRVAGANAIVAALGTTRRLYIYRNDVLIVPAEYTSAATVVEENGQVYIDMGMPSSATPISNGALRSGTWRFEMSGGDNYSLSITGRAGSTTSGAAVQLSGDMMSGVGFTTAIRLVFPDSLES